MPVNKRVISQDYNTITVLLDVEISTDTTDTLLDADTLSFYDSNVPNSADIQLGLKHAFWNLSGDADNSGGRITLSFNHQSTDTVLLNLTGSGQISFSAPLSFPEINPNGESNAGYNGDINYDAEGNTTGHAVLTFNKISGYKMAWAGWRKPTQKIN